ncbi:hypothetical protein VNI00_015619 [Paramarasmius palmivorus]|uniref:Uncharacterized protein n=1 Tax=Paramarasmius palmivorus TaxID=297713 RepID=A0AAW0BK14_9AGAR
MLPASLQETHKFLFDNVKQNQSDPPITNGSIQLEINGRCDPPDSIKKPIIFRLWKENRDGADSLPLRCEDAPFHPVFSNLSSGWYNVGAAIKDGEWLGDSRAQVTIDASLATASSSSTSSNSSASVSSSSGMETTAPTASSTTSNNHSSRSDTDPKETDKGVNVSQETRNSANPAIIGGAVGGGITLIIVILIVLYLCRRRRRSRRRNSALGFNRTLMVKNSGHREIEVEMESRPYSDYHYPSSSTASVVVSDSELMEKPTERQKEIDERMRHLQDLLSTLESQPRTEADESIGKVRDRIKRFTFLKEGDWAKEMSDEKPVELS